MSQRIPQLLPLLFSTIALLVLAIACGGSAPAATHELVPLRADAPTVIPAEPPTPTPTPPPPELVLNDLLGRQGGFFTVKVTGAPAAVGDVRATFNGSTYRMLPNGSGDWVGAVGLPNEADTGWYRVVVSGEGLPTLTGSVLIDPTNFVVDYLTVPDDSAGLLLDQVAVLQEIATLKSLHSGFTSPARWSGAWIMPVSGPITDPFGAMRSINGGAFSSHTGTDIGAEEGTPVMAAASGRVVYAGQLYLRGGSIVIDHGGGVYSGYHHLSGIAVQEGQVVGAGNLIGYVGTTGFSSGPHLHWEAVVQGVRVDALLFMQLRS